MGEVEALIVEGGATVSVQFFKPEIQLQANGRMRLVEGCAHIPSTTALLHAHKPRRAAWDGGRRGIDFQTAPEISA